MIPPKKPADDSWHCANCDTPNAIGAVKCVACGWTRMARRVVLSAEGGNEIGAGITTTFGQRTLAQYGLADAEFASAEQFELVRDDGHGRWQIRHIGSAANPTFYDGRAWAQTP